MSGELYQARRAPGDLERATKEFEKAAAMGQTGDSGIALRQAQIDVQLGRYDEAIQRIDQLRKQGKGGPGAENLAVLILDKQGKKARGPQAASARPGPGIPAPPSWRGWRRPS